MPQDVFERYAEAYDLWYEEHQREYQAELARISSVHPALDSYAIEVGVGSGRFAAPLGIPLGLEPSRALAEMARRRGIEVIRGRAECIPLKDGSCSSVLLVTVLCYLDDPSRAFREIHRILSPEGNLIIGFIERGGEIERKYRYRKGKSRFLSHACFYPPGEVQALLTDSGFFVHEIDSKFGFCVLSAGKGERMAPAGSGCGYIPL
jgi:SAM-dependent methyltransferase